MLFEPSVTSASCAPLLCTFKYSSVLLPNSFERPGPKSVSPAMNCSGVAVVVSLKWIVDIRVPFSNRLSLKICHQLAQIHFCIPRLEAPFHRRLHSSLVLRSLHALKEEIGIATNLFGSSKGNCVDATLDDGVPGGWKTGDPKRERSHEIIQLSGG